MACPLTTKNKLCTYPIKLVPPFRSEAEPVHSRIHLEVDVNLSLTEGEISRHLRGLAVAEHVQVVILDSGPLSGYEVGKKLRRAA